MTLPSLFIPHGGGPCFFMEWTMGPPDSWDGMRASLESLAGRLPERPNKILCVSSHWEEPVFTVGGNAAPGMIYDYYGFPPHTYELRYPAPGDPGLAARVHDLLTSAGMPVTIDPDRGFDHGVFVPLMVAFPDAEIPVVPMSLRHGLDPAEHIAMGKALAPLRDEGVLIIGSGMSYHNMRGFVDGVALADSARFDAWLASVVEADDKDRRIGGLTHWEQGDRARPSHPREEHLIPLMVTAGAALDEPGRKMFTDVVMTATISGFSFG